MSIHLARAAIVGIVAGTTPTLNGLGLGALFTHDTGQGEASTSRVSRSFYLWTVASSGRGYFTKTRVHESIVNLEIHVFYKDCANRALLDELIEADRQAISDRLLNETLWDRPTSGIINLASPGLALLPSRRDSVVGGYDSVISIPLHHR